MNSTIKYDPAAQERKQNIYIEEYYSGVDCNVYIDDRLDENIAGIGYTVQEQLKPLFGYASRVYDDVSVGNRLVTGMIRIPIANPASTDFVVAASDKKTDLRITEISSETEGYAMPDYSENFWDYNPTGSNNMVPEWVRLADYSNESISNPYPNVISNEITNSYRKNYPAITISMNDASGEYVSDSSVLQAQYMLGAVGYDIDYSGILDSKTAAAIINFQIDNSLPVTGSVDKDTFERLTGLTAYESNKRASADMDTEAYVGPGINYSIVDNVPTWTTLIVLSESGDFTRVVLPNGKEGYVESSKITVAL